MRTKQFLSKLIVCVFLSLSATSCLTTKTSVGGFKEAQGNEYVYSKSKQIWLFWGLMPLGRTNTNTPANGQCEVITRFNVVDLIITGCTAGLITTETIKVVAKK